MRTLVVGRHPGQLLLTALLLAVLATLAVVVIAAVVVPPLAITAPVSVTAPISGSVVNQPIVPAANASAPLSTTSYESATHMEGVYPVVPNGSVDYDPESGSGMAGGWWHTAP